jgi:hypothetical protein
MLAAASYPIKLNDVIYNVAPLDDVDIVELDNYVRQVHIETAATSAVNLPAAVQDRILSIAVKQASGLSAMSPEGAMILRNTAGVARMLWQGIKRNHPDVTYEKIRSLITSKESIAEANRVFHELNVKPLEEVAALNRGKRVSQRRVPTSTKRSSKGSSSRRKR